MLSKRAKKTKGRCKLGYVRYRKVSIMHDSRAHAGKWKRLRRVNGIPEKRTDSRRTYGFMMKRGKQRLIAVDGDVVAVMAVEEVVVRVSPVRAMIRPEQTMTRSLRQPLVESGMLAGQIGPLGINLSFFFPSFFSPSTHVIITSFFPLIQCRGASS